MRLSVIAGSACSFMLLLPSVSSEAFPALDPCWRQCLTHLLPCPDGSWTCACREAHETSLLSDSIACIRQNCTAGQPFSPTVLLTPFQEKCKYPLAPRILANANSLAAQNTAPSLSVVATTTPASSKADNLAIKVAATPGSPPSAGDVTTTYIGIVTDANGQQETFTVPALIKETGTVYGKPVTEVQGTATPTSTVTLPWPTLPVGYFSQPQTAANGATFVVQAPRSVYSATSRSTAAASTSTQASQQKGNGDHKGTILDTSDGPKHEAASSLGLMVVLMVGVMWF